MAIIAPPKSTACTAHTHHLAASRRSSAYTFTATCLRLPSSSSTATASGTSCPTQSVTPVKHFVKHLRGKPNICFLDVNPLCFDGSRPCMKSFAYWFGLFFSKVSLQDPVIAVLDGEEGHKHKRHLLPSYKADRKCRNGASNGWLNQAEPQIVENFQKCNVPVVKVKEYEADDIIATLTDQALENGYKIMTGSPDKDFKQLISNDVEMTMAVPELR